MQDQDCFRKEEGWKELLQLIPDSKIVANLEKKWVSSEDRSSDEKWSDLRDAIMASYSPDERVDSIQFLVFLH